MGLIHVLDTEVSNKIAAGEVVEKPLSIVKELVENSIDAGASLITVEIRNGGISYIRVTDNGSGMSEEDAKICFLRHATSKIQTGSDLEAIYTLGFRGEALSSIGAVSKVRLYTKRRQDEVGICVTCEGGEILSSADAGAPNGTVIEVSDLFYNTPARLKFLKKPATEGGYISDLMARYVFAHPEISFKLIREGKETIFSSGDNKLINAIYSVYGRDFAKNMLEVDYQYNDIHVAGMIGKGTLSRANRNNETFFVNKRYIKSAILIRALEEAYKNQIMISKFPTAILNVEVAAGDVDINVHPTKLECKFSNESEIYQAVYHAAKSALYALPNVPEIERAEKKEAGKVSQLKAEGGEQKTIEELYSEKLRESMKPSNDFKFKAEHRETPRPSWDEIKKPEPQRELARDTSSPKPAIPVKDDETSAFEKLMNRARAAEHTAKKAESIPAEAPKPEENAEVPQIQTETAKRPVDTFAMLDYALELGKKKSRFAKVKDSEDGGQPAENDALPDWREYRDRANEEYAGRQEENIFNDGYFRVIGQLFETYILVEKDDRLLMIDQHAAHERLNFEALKQEMENTGIVSQMMLEPVEIKLSGEEFAVYAEHEKDFYDLGFEITNDGESAVAISAVPGDISWSEAEPLFIELLTQAENMNRELMSYDKERLLYTISCKAAIKANMEISEPEMKSLVERVFKLKNINTCPHGRPIVISMSKKEIEKNFKRIV
ncbi:MAG: DNA mismatch repair endonuclease MutL [Candidatus Ornithomonoglobus sp.]